MLIPGHISHTQGGGNGKITRRFPVSKQKHTCVVCGTNFQQNNSKNNYLTSSRVIYKLVRVLRSLRSTVASVDFRPLRAVWTASGTISSRSKSWGLCCGRDLARRASRSALAEHRVLWSEDGAVYRSVTRLLDILGQQRDYVRAFGLIAFAAHPMQSTAYEESERLDRG